jgi:hypothetical protein
MIPSKIITPKEALLKMMFLKDADQEFRDLS